MEESKRPRLCADDLTDVVIRCKESSAASALKNHFGCDRAYVRVMRYADVKTFNKNIRLWSSTDKLPAAPFGAGLYYAKTSRLVPLFMVQNLQPIQTRTAIKDLEGGSIEKKISLAEVVTWVINYIASFDTNEHSESAEKTEIARAFMWRMCDADTRVLLGKLEAAREIQFPRGTSAWKGIDDSVSIGEGEILQKENWLWINDWVQGRAKVLHLDA